MIFLPYHLNFKLLSQCVNRCLWKVYLLSGGSCSLLRARTFVDGRPCVSLNSFPTNAKKYKTFWKVSWYFVKNQKTRPRENLAGGKKKKKKKTFTNGSLVFPGFCGAQCSGGDQRECSEAAHVQKCRKSGNPRAHQNRAAHCAGYKGSQGADTATSPRLWGRHCCCLSKACCGLVAVHCGDGTGKGLNYRLECMPSTWSMVSDTGHNFSES